MGRNVLVKMPRTVSAGVQTTVIRGTATCEACSLPTEAVADLCWPVLTCADLCSSTSTRVPRHARTHARTRFP